MKINWIVKKGHPKDVAALLELEYQFRAQITQVLLRKFDDELMHWDDVAFDFCTSKKTFQLATTTPEPFYSELSVMFKEEPIALN